MKNLLKFLLLSFEKQFTPRTIKQFFSKQLTNCSLQLYFFSFFIFLFIVMIYIYILNIFHGRVWSTDDQQWRRSAGIPPLVNAASRRQLEVSSSGWNRFQTRKFFREAPLIELFNGKTGINDWFHSWRGRTRCAKKKKKWTVRNN